MGGRPASLAADPLVTATQPAPRRPVVVILGGGLSGAATALHLARTADAEIVVVEPRETLGAGLAYSTDDPEHRINVRASRMTIYADDPGHFEGWLAAEQVPMSPGTLTLRGDSYPQRAIFGRYVAAQLAPHVASGAIRHLRTTAVETREVGRRMRIGLADGGCLAADLVVLAMTHPVPTLPDPLRGLCNSARMVADPYDAGQVGAIGPDERVLIVGTGLTAADVIASLDRRGHRGPIAALSRHGLRSRGQDVARQTSCADFVTAPSDRSVALLRRVRAAISADLKAGVAWQATIDAVRTQGQAIWAALGPAERARLVRHLRPFWDVHRFRVAPQVEAILDRLAARGRLDLIAARILSVREMPGGLVVEYRRRHDGAQVGDRFDRVILATGPDHAGVIAANPVLRSLAAAGLVQRDRHGLGLLVADHCRAVDARDCASDSIFIAGPLARGTVGELMGAAEVARHAERTAATLRCRLEATRAVAA